LNYNALADRWFYVVGWRPSESGYRGDDFAVVVLMNGSVLPTSVRDCAGEGEVHVEH
jgi:hypothetical protein